MTGFREELLRRELSTRTIGVYVNEAFKAERAIAWKQIQKQGAEMDRLSGHWTVEQNKVDWKQAKPLLDELRSAQEKAETIAHTMDEQPAAKIRKRGSGSAPSRPRQTAR